MVKEVKELRVNILSKGDRKVYQQDLAANG